MATYLVLDIELGPCLDQQVHAAVVALVYGEDERRAAILHHEWTWGTMEVRSITVWEEGRSGTGVECEGCERSELVGGSCMSTHGNLRSSGHRAWPLP